MLQTLDNVPMCLCYLTLICFVASFIFCCRGLVRIIDSRTRLEELTNLTNLSGISNT